MADQEDFASLLRQFEQAHPTQAQRDPEVGDSVRGKILSLGQDFAFVDLGAKSEGSLEIEALKDADGTMTAGVGDTVEAVVTGKDEETGTLLLGSKQGRRMHGGGELEHALQHHLPVEGLVSGVTKGGVEVQIAGLRAFCPASQIDIRFVEDLESFVGQRLAFRVTRYEGGRHANLVVSRRALLEEARETLAAQTRARLEEGAVLPGTVTSLKDYGAFVDIGGIEGMIHISELAFGRVQHPKDVLTAGQQVEVMVLRVENSADARHPQKIALSLRALAKDPWQEAVQRFPVGELVPGTVTRLQPFGAFVELAPGIEGMIHISELGAGRRVTHPHEVLAEGATVEATVLDVDLEKRRIALSLDASRRGNSTSEASTYAEYGKPKQSLGTLGDLLKETLKKGK